MSTYKSGISIKGLKFKNKALILQLIATNPGISRVNISKFSGLSKMAVGNIITELIDADIVEEFYTPTEKSNTGSGRTPVMLKISEKSPCICGMLIKRGIYYVVISDLSGTIYDQVVYKKFKPLTADELIHLMQEGFSVLKARTSRKILAVGISSIGPINDKTGYILNPPNFYGIEQVPIVPIMEEYTSVPVFLINDGNAGALAEKIYGSGKSISNFIYLHIMYGIGSGFVLENKLYRGDNGESGDIGHSTINFSGPKCTCGNTGCLEVYANIQTLRSYIAEHRPLYPDSSIAQMQEPSLIDIVDAANQGDFLAISAIDVYSEYLKHATINLLKQLNLSKIIIDYDSTVPGHIFETILEHKITASKVISNDIEVIRSQYKGQAPLIGSVALIADKVFNNLLEL